MQLCLGTQQKTMFFFLKMRLILFSKLTIKELLVFFFLGDITTGRHIEEKWSKEAASYLRKDLL